MKEFLFPITDYLKGKKVSPVIYRILNILFTLNISSLIFQKVCFKYQWVDITDYKKILTFLIELKFLIPLIICFLVHHIISFIARIIFVTSTEMKYPIVTNIIMLLRFYAGELRIIKEQIKSNPNETTILINKPIWLKIYERLKKIIPPSKWMNLKSKLIKQQLDSINDFEFAFKLLIVSTIYFSRISFSGWYLYIIIILIVLIHMAFICASYVFADIFVIAFRDFDFEKEEIIT